MTHLELRIALDALGINHSDLARKLHVSRRFVAYWLTGEKPIPISVAMLLNLLLDNGLTIKDLRS